MHHKERPVEDLAPIDQVRLWKRFSRRWHGPRPEKSAGPSSHLSRLAPFRPLSPIASPCSASVVQTLEREHDEKTKVKNVHVVEMGQWELDTWYYSPFPDVSGRPSQVAFPSPHTHIHRQAALSNHAAFVFAFHGH